MLKSLWIGLVVLGSATAVMSCSGLDQSDPANDENVQSYSEALTKCQQPNAPEAQRSNYCDDPACPCTLGEGDCDSSTQCVAPLACTGKGSHFGFATNFNACAGAHCNNKVKDGDETAVDCGGSCGTFNCPADACAGLPPNGQAGHCTAQCPCPAGGYSCATGRCQGALVCASKAGARWGINLSVNICEGAFCLNGVKDGDETGADCGGSCAPCGGATQISFRQGGPVNDEASSMAIDGSGNITIAGKFSGTINLGGATLTSAGLSDIFVAKYSPTGAHLWSKRFGSARPDGDAAVAVATDSKNSVYLVGNIYESVDFGGGPITSVGANASAFIAKFTSSGSHIWSKAFGGPEGNKTQSIAVTPAGVIYVSGAFQDSINLGGSTFTAASAPGSGFWDAFAAKFDTSGVHQWSKAYGSPTDDQGNSIALDTAGNAYLGGHFSDTVSFGGTNLTSLGSNDGFGLKLLGTTGATVWAQRFGGIGEDRVAAVAVGSNLNPVFVGYHRGVADFGGGPHTAAGTTDAFVTSRNTNNGAFVWAHAFGGAATDFATAVTALASTNDVAVAGYFQGSMDAGGGSTLTSAGSNDEFVVRYTATGNVAWQKRYGAAGNDKALAITASASAIPVMGITGSFSNAVSFGGPTLTSAGGTDIFVATYGF